MRPSVWVFAILIGFSSLATALNPMNSAYRQPDTSYKKYVKKFKRYIETLSKTRRSGETPLDVAVPVHDLDFSHVTPWVSEGELKSAFERVRDWRYLETYDHPHFLRRNSWLYPDDGCFARAALMNSNLLQWNHAVPSKAFVFGDLSVATNNSPNGRVTWWYHVVPIVSVGNQPFVLDPAIDPRSPMPLMDWLKSMTSDLKGLTVALCASGSYDPSSPCDEELKSYDTAAESDQMNYLDLEWSRVKKLHRDPVRELGDEPPWKSNVVKLSNVMIRSEIR